MNETAQTLLLSAGVFVVAYAALPFVIKPKFKKLRVNGTNGLFKIHINPDAPHKYAVVAHELAEWRYRYRRPWLWTRLRGESGAREVNLWGPAVETAYAVQFYGQSEDTFIAKEARALASRDYFSSDAGRIERQIKRRMPEAHEWVSDNLDKIEEA